MAKKYFVEIQKIISTFCPIFGQQLFFINTKKDLRQAIKDRDIFLEPTRRVDRPEKIKKYKNYRNGRRDFRKMP